MIYEPFCGRSGTNCRPRTQRGGGVYAMELARSYCDVAVAALADGDGKKAMTSSRVTDGVKGGQLPSRL